MGERKITGTTNLDIVQILACVMVVIIHETGNFSNYVHADDMSLSVIRTFCEISVPLFIMKSGTLLLRKEYIWTYRKMFQKIWRIGSVILFWGMFYNVVSNTMIYGLSGRVFLISIKSVLSADTSFNYQFWYLYMLLGLYAITPIIKPFTDKAEKTDLIYLLCCCGLIGCVLPYLFGLVSVECSSVWLIKYFPLFSGYLFYYILGIYLYRYGISRKTVIVGICIMITFGYLSATCMDKWLSYFSPCTMTGAALLYEGIRRIKTEEWHLKTRKILHWMAGLCFGIYILHPMVIVAIRKILHLDCSIIQPVCMGVLVMSALTFLICMIGSEALKKIPILKELVKL